MSQGLESQSALSSRMWGPGGSGAPGMCLSEGGRSGSPGCGVSVAGGAVPRQDVPGAVPAPAPVPVPVRAGQRRRFLVRGGRRGGAWRW